MALNRRADKHGRLIVGVVGLVALTAAVTACGRPAEASVQRDCGTKELYGHALRIHVAGKPIPCSQVREIVKGRCRDGHVWSCFSFRSPAPILVWFRDRERFHKHWSTTIEARRYPCTDASVTPSSWAASRGDSSAAFPSRAQVLADDLIRCGLLKGKSYDEVRRLLGAPDEPVSRHYLDYDIGLERDSFIQVDSEVLSIGFDRSGRFRSIEIYQS
ncbi:MAG: hypothetical protein ACJ768_02840 [Gaiellaceae bacterium]